MISKIKDFIRNTSQVTLIDPEAPNKERVPFSDIYTKAQGPIILKFLRRFGCLLCREGSFDLCELNKEFENKYGKEKVTIFGIGLEMLGYDDFKKGNYFPCGRVFVDDKRALYEAAGFEKVGFFSMIPKLLSSDTRKRIKEASQKGFDGDLKGEKSQIGGMLILSPQGEILYEFKQKNFGDEPSKDEIFKALDTYFAK